MKSLISLTFLLISLPLSAQPFISIEGNISTPQENFLNSVDILPTISAGHRFSALGVSVSHSRKPDIITRATVDWYTFDWLIVSVGPSFMSFDSKHFNGSPFTDHSTGFSGSLAVEFKITDNLKLGTKFNHDLHGAKIQGEYEWLGNTSTGVYAKFML